MPKLQTYLTSHLVHLLTRVPHLRSTSSSPVMTVTWRRADVGERQGTPQKKAKLCHRIGSIGQHKHNLRLRKYRWKQRADSWVRCAFKNVPSRISKKRDKLQNEHVVWCSQLILCSLRAFNKQKEKVYEMLLGFYCCQVMHGNFIRSIKPIVFLKMCKENSLLFKILFGGVRIKGSTRLTTFSFSTTLFCCFHPEIKTNVCHHQGVKIVKKKKKSIIFECNLRNCISVCEHCR